MSGKNRPRKIRSPRTGTGSDYRGDVSASSGVTRPSNGSGIYSRESGVSVTGMNPLKSSYADLLSNNSNDEYSQLLASLGIQQSKNLNNDQKADYNKQLLDMILKHYADQEQRDYNKSVLDEQRLYDNPLNQLARLMGAGISRDAALQLLSGAGSGSGSGAALVGGAAEGVPTGLAPSESTLNGVEARTAIANTVFGAIGSLASGIGALGSFGLSAATLHTNLAATQAATAGQLLGNKQLSQTLAGIDAASTIIGTLSTAMDVGFMAHDQTFDSSQDMLKYISDNASKYEPFQAMVDSGALRNASKDLYTLNALNAGYRSWRQSRDYGIDRDYITKMYTLDQLYKGTDIDRLNSEIDLNHQRIAQSIQDVINSTLLANKQADVFTQQAYNLDMQTALANQQYDLNQYNLDWLDANIDDINDIRTVQINLDSQRWRALENDPKAWSAEIESWLSNKANLRSAIAIESYYYGSREATLNDIQNSPDGPTDQNFAKWVTYMHNLFSQAALPKPGMSNEQSNNILGSLSGSDVAMWALGKFAKLSVP